MGKSASVSSAPAYVLGTLPPPSARPPAFCLCFAQQGVSPPDLPKSLPDSLGVALMGVFLCFRLPPLPAGRELRTLLQLEAVVPPAEAELAAAVNIFGDEIFAQLSNEVRRVQVAGGVSRRRAFRSCGQTYMLPPPLAPRRLLLRPADQARWRPWPHHLPVQHRTGPGHAAEWGRSQRDFLPAAGGGWVGGDGVQVPACK